MDSVAILESRIIALESAIKVISAWVKFDSAKLAEILGGRPQPVKNEVEDMQEEDTPKIINVEGNKSKECEVNKTSDQEISFQVDSAPASPVPSDSSADGIQDTVNSVNETFTSINLVKKLVLAEEVIRNPSLNLVDDYKLMNSYIKLKRCDAINPISSAKTTKGTTVSSNSSCAETKIRRIPRYVSKKGLCQVDKKCDKCDKVFRLNKELLEHKKKEHKHSGWRTCPHCNKRIYNKYKYEIHLRLHTGERPFLCSTCGSGFRANYQLLEHLKTHTDRDVRPFICKYCGHGCRTKSLLSIHERIHEGTNEKTCPHCNGRFVNLKAHIQGVHEKLRPFECHLCDKKFKKISHLKRHVATHSNPNRRIKGYHIERPGKAVREGRRTVMRMFDFEDGREGGNMTKLTSNSSQDADDAQPLLNLVVDELNNSIVESPNNYTPTTEADPQSLLNNVEETVEISEIHVVVLPKKLSTE